MHLLGGKLASWLLAALLAAVPVLALAQSTAAGPAAPPAPAALPLSHRAVIEPPGGEPAAAPLAVEQIAPGVFVHQGRIADFAPDNGGDLANLGFVVGSRCVAVIDTGGSFRVGAGLLAAVRANTRLPVCWVIATHMHPDHLLGHAAFRPEHPVFVAAARQLPALAARAEGYLQRQRENLGAALAEGTVVVPPDHLVSASEDLDLGGRVLQLRAWNTAHTDNDLSVKDSASGVLFTGDLLFIDHLPVIDGRLRGWLQQLPALAALAGGLVVPGHGPVTRDGAADIAREQAYLQGVADEVHAAIHKGLTISQAVAASVPPAGWQLTELYHRRNITAAYAELEWED